MLEAAYRAKAIAANAEKLLSARWLTQQRAAPTNFSDVDLTADLWYAEGCVQRLCTSVYSRFDGCWADYSFQRQLRHSLILLHPA